MYGFGDFGFNLFFTYLSLFLLIYYTNVLNIPPATAGLMIGLPVFWDAITDPLMGWLASRTTTKFGRYRPYLLFATPLMSLSFIAMFAAPVVFPQALILASVLAHLLFRTFYTVVNVPYTAMSAALSQDSKTRGWLAAARMVLGPVAGLIAAVLSFPLAQKFGNGNLVNGFLTVSFFYAIIATGAIFAVWATTQEDMQQLSQAPNLTLKQTWSFLSHNSAFLILTAAIFFSAVGSTILINGLNYYVEDVIGAVGQQGLVLLPFLLGLVLLVPFWAWLSTKISKAKTWVIAGIPGLLMNILIYMIAPKDISTLAILMFVNGLFSGATVVMYWSMLPDTVEFGEWRSGVRDEAIGFGLVQFSAKAAGAIGIGFIGFILASLAYTSPDLREGTLSQTTLDGIRTLAFLGPLLFSVTSLAIISFYPIDNQKHRRLVQAIHRRKARA